jgi:hypothetical protein
MRQCEAYEALVGGRGAVAKWKLGRAARSAARTVRLELRVLSDEWRIVERLLESLLTVRRFSPAFLMRRRLFPAKMAGLYMPRLNRVRASKMARSIRPQAEN